MNIKRMTATFGRLDHATLELKDGINIVTLPNEGGKSTWCAFLRVMLYGLNTRERSRKDYLADKTHYQPWNGGNMEGELLCEWGGRDILIRRFTVGSTPMGGFEAIYADTGAEVKGLTRDNVGEALLGISRNVFERSAFLNQSQLTVTQDPQLERQLSAVVSSGEEGVSASQVREKLSDWQRKRMYKTRGAIPTLEAQKAELEGAEDSARDLTSSIRRYRVEIDKLETLAAQLRYQVALHQARADSAQAKAYQQAEQELSDAKQQLERLEGQMPAAEDLPQKAELEAGRDEVAYLRTVDQRLKQLAKELPEAEQTVAHAEEIARNPVFDGTAAEARSKAEEAKTKLEQLEQKQVTEQRNAWLVPLLAAVLGGGAFGISWWKLPNPKQLPVIALCCALIFLIGLLRGVFCRRTAGRCQRQMQELLAQFHVERKDQISEMTEAYCGRLDGVHQAQAGLERLRNEEVQQKQERERTWNHLHQLVHAFAPEVKDVFGFSAAITRSLTLMDAVANAEERVQQAQKLFEAVSVHGSGCGAGSVLEEPAIPLEKAQEGLNEANRRIMSFQSQLDMAMGQRKAIGDQEEVQEKLEQVERSLEEYRRDYQALTIALEALDEADVEMQNRFSPALNRRAGAYFNRLTKGKYAKVRINREMDAGAELPDSVVAHDVLELSQGTADQLWLAVRLAVCDLALPQDHTCPLVLDDALVNFDDERTVTALDLLEEISRRRQVLLFTCHAREQQLYRAHGAAGKEAP